MRNRKIETAKLACFLNSLKPSLIRVVRREKMERRKSTIGIATATKAMILKNILHRRPCCSEGNLLACLTRQATALSRSVTNLQFLMGPEVQGSLPHLIPRKAGPLAMGMP
jgi:hypothetical protein